MTDQSAPIPDWRRWVDRIGFIPARLAWGATVYAPIDLDTAKQVAAVVEEACRTLHTGAPFPGDAGAPRFTDEQVDRVIEALCHEWDIEGRNRSRGHWICQAHPEAGHPHPLRFDCRYPPDADPDTYPSKVTWYDLRALPVPTKRALVERIWRLWQEWSEGGAKQLTLHRHQHQPPFPVATGGAAGSSSPAASASGSAPASAEGQAASEAIDDWVMWIG